MSAICGTDLHLVRGTMQGLVPDTVLGHEAVEVVEKVAESVRGFTPGERVVICSTVACGTCSCCRAGYFSPCDTASPNGPAAGTSFFGGPETTGPAEAPRDPLAPNRLSTAESRLGGRVCRRHPPAGTRRRSDRSRRRVRSGSSRRPRRRSGGQKRQCLGAEAIAVPQMAGAARHPSIWAQCRLSPLW